MHTIPKISSGGCKPYLEITTLKDFTNIYIGKYDENVRLYKPLTTHQEKIHKMKSTVQKEESKEKSNSKRWYGSVRKGSDPLSGTDKKLHLALTSQLELEDVIMLTVKPSNKLRLSRSKPKEAYNNDIEANENNCEPNTI